MVMKIDLRLVISSAAIAVLFIFPGIAYLLEAKLLDSVATLWGSALGAIAAVGGAFWVADRQANQQRKGAAALVHAMFLPTVVTLHQLTLLYGAPSRPTMGDVDAEPDSFDVEKWEKIKTHATSVVDHFKKFNIRLHRYEAGLALLSAEDLTTALALETTLENCVQDVVISLQYPPQTYDTSNGWAEAVAGPPTWSSRSKLAGSDQIIQTLMFQLDPLNL